MKEVYVEGIDVAQLNQFVRDQVCKVRVIYQKIIDVDLSDMIKVGAPTDLVD
jgi:helix-turn-helix protein